MQNSSKKVVVRLARREEADGYLYPSLAGEEVVISQSSPEKQFSMKSKLQGSGKLPQKRSHKGRGRKRHHSSGCEDSSSFGNSSGDEDKTRRKKKKKKKTSKKSKKKDTVTSSQLEASQRLRDDDDPREEREPFYYVIPSSGEVEQQEGEKIRHPDACCQCSATSQCIRCPCRREKKSCRNCPTPFCKNNNPNPPKYYSFDMPTSGLFKNSKNVLISKDMIKKKSYQENANNHQEVKSSEMLHELEEAKVTRSLSCEDSSFSDNDEAPSPGKKKKKKKQTRKRKKRDTATSSQIEASQTLTCLMEDEEPVEEKEHFYYVIPSSAAAEQQEREKMRHPDACCQCAATSQCIRCPCRREKKSCRNCPTPFCKNNNPNPPKHYSFDMSPNGLFKFSKHTLMSKDMIKKKNEQEKENNRRDVIRSEMPSKHDEAIVTFEESKLISDNKILTVHVVHEPSQTSQASSSLTAQSVMNIDYFSDLQEGSFYISEETGLPMSIENAGMSGSSPNDGAVSVYDVSEVGDKLPSDLGLQKEINSTCESQLVINSSGSPISAQRYNFAQNVHVKSEVVHTNDGSWRSSETSEVANVVPTLCRPSENKGKTVGSVYVTKQNYSSGSESDTLHVVQMPIKEEKVFTGDEVSDSSRTVLIDVKSGSSKFVSSAKVFSKRCDGKEKTCGVRIDEMLNESAVHYITDNVHKEKSKRTLSSHSECVATTFSERTLKRHISNNVPQTVITDVTTRDLSVPDAIIIVTHPIWKKEPRDVSEQSVHIISRKESKSFSRTLLQPMSCVPSEDVTDRGPKTKSVPEVVIRHRKLKQKGKQLSSVQSIGLVVLGGKVKKEYLVPGIYDTSSLKEILYDEDSSDCGEEPDQDLLEVV